MDFFGFVGNPTNLVTSVRVDLDKETGMKLPRVKDEIVVLPVCAIVGFPVLNPLWKQNFERRIARELGDFNEEKYMVVTPLFPFWVPGNSFLGGCSISILK